MILNNRARLDAELQKLQTNIIRLSSMVETMIDEAIRALETNSLDLARQVVVEDRHTNQLRYEIEQECQMILATQAPTAIDLRRVLSALHIAVELERMGDHAAGIGTLIERLRAEPPFEMLHSLPKMARRARKMVYMAVESYVKADTNLARDVMARDRKINRGYYKLFEASLIQMSNPSYVKRGTYLLWMGHNLERIADRAVNIAERTIYMTTGQFEESPAQNMDWDDQEMTEE